MIVCKRLWYGLQDDSLQGLDMVQFTRHIWQGNNFQDIGMDTVNKNMVHNLNLYGMWIYDYKNACTSREKREKLILGS